MTPQNDYVGGHRLVKFMQKNRCIYLFPWQSTCYFLEMLVHLDRLSMTLRETRFKLNGFLR